MDKQYTSSSPESEDELDTQGPAGNTADPGLEAVSSTQQEDKDMHDGPSTSSSTSFWDSVQPLVSTMLPAGALLLVLSWLLRRLRRSRRHKPQQQLQQQQEPEPEPTLSIYASNFKLENSSSPRNAQLSGLRCVVAENLAVQVSLVV